MWEKVEQWFSQWLKKLQATDIKSSKSRSILLYLCFVVISAVLWCFLTFNNMVSIDMQLPMTIVGKPGNVRLLGNVPDTITVTVTNRGHSFVKYIFKSPPEIELKFSDYADGNGSFRVDAMQLKKLISRSLGRSATIAAVLPENVSVKYTDGPGKKVPVVIDIDAKPQLLYMQTGPTIASVDTVVVYADQPTLNNIDKVYTYHVKAYDLTDTLRRPVTLAPIKGAVIEPRSIEITVPIEKMVTHRLPKVQISVRNVPAGMRVIVFPSSVDVSYRAPVSSLRRKEEVTVVVDYNAIAASTTNKVGVSIGEAPADYQDFRLSIDSVEYIIEKQRKL